MPLEKRLASFQRASYRYSMDDQISFGMAVEAANNPSKRCPCVLVLDVSSSMAGNSIEQLKHGVDAYFFDLLADAKAKRTVELAVVTFGNSAKVVADFQTIDKFVVPELIANGNTPMASALLEAIRIVRKRKTELRSVGLSLHRPWIVLITDGAPTDDASTWKHACDALALEVERDGLLLLAIGVEAANVDKLRELPCFNGPQRLSTMKFAEFFQWLSDSQKAVSGSKLGDKLILPPPTWVIQV